MRKQMSNAEVFRIIIPGKTMIIFNYSLKRMIMLNGIDVEPIPYGVRVFS